MSTRSAIGMRCNDGAIRAVYAHWDGYPAHNGKILQENYNRTNTESLLEHGNISILGKVIGDKHNFLDRAPEGACTFYARDRSDVKQTAQTFQCSREYLEQFEYIGVEYYYLLEDDGNWYVSEGSNDWQLVSDVLNHLEEA